VYGRWEQRRWEPEFSRWGESGETAPNILQLKKRKEAGVNKSYKIVYKIELRLTFSSDDANVEDLFKIPGWKKLDVKGAMSRYFSIFLKT